MDRARLQWGGFLLIVLVLFILLCLGAEHSSIFDVSIVDQETLTDLCAGKEFIQNPGNLQELIFFQEEQIPYDAATNTFYVTQNMDTDEYEGTLTAVDGVHLYFGKTDYLSSKDKLLESGGILTLWIITEDRYTLCEVTCTGLPVFQLISGDGITQSYGTGTAVLWEPYDEELATIAKKSSDSLIKKSVSGETYSVKFRKDNGTDSRKLSLLSSEKYDAWKLYQVSDKDGTFIRSFLAYQLWNHFDSSGLLQRDCYLIELLINNSYQGLYLLLPRVDDDYFDGSNVSILQTNDVSVDLTGAEPHNLLDYYLFLQMTYAHQNVSCGQYFINMENASYLMPERIEYCMGISPERLGYLDYLSTSNMIQMSDFVSAQEQASYLEQNASSRWCEARETFLTEEALTQGIDDMSSYLIKSGFITRYIANVENWLDYQSNLDELYTYFTERLIAIDEYYSQTN